MSKNAREVSLRADGVFNVWEKRIDPAVDPALHNAQYVMPRWVLVKATPFEEVADAWLRG